VAGCSVFEHEGLPVQICRLLEGPEGRFVLTVRRAGAVSDGCNPFVVPFTAVSYLRWKHGGQRWEVRVFHGSRLGVHTKRHEVFARSVSSYDEAIELAGSLQQEVEHLPRPEWATMAGR
jgi:hypothetical protein